MSMHPSPSLRPVVARAAPLWTPLVLLVLSACGTDAPDGHVADESAQLSPVFVDEPVPAQPALSEAADRDHLQDVSLVVGLPGQAGVARAIDPSVRWTQLGHQLTVDAHFMLPKDGRSVPVRLFATARPSDDRPVLLAGELILPGERHRLTGQLALPSCYEQHCWQLVTAHSSATLGDPVTIRLAGR
jgi:hypothetical protein